MYSRAYSACGGLTEAAALLNSRSTREPSAPSQGPRRPFLIPRWNTIECQQKNPQRIFFWGARSSLPHNPKTTQMPTESFFFANHPKKWREIRFGPNFGLAIDESDDCYVWWTDVETNTKVEPHKITCINGKIRDAACGENNIYAVTRDGRPWEISFERTGPRAQYELEARLMDEIPAAKLDWFGSSNAVKEISVGRQHVGFILNNDDVHIVGNNTYGQCSMTRPLPFKCKSVHCGGAHTVVIDTDGQPHAFGYDASIQLGLGDTRTMCKDDLRKAQVWNSDGSHEKANAALKRSVIYKHYELHQQTEPQMCMPCPHGRNRDPLPIEPHKVALGEDFTVFAVRDSPDDWDQDETHILFACGENRHGQCGRNLQHHHQQWNKVRTPKYMGVESMRCGTSHCLTIVGKGEMYGWGKNNQKQAVARHGSGGIQVMPEFYELPGTSKYVSADFDASCVIIDPNPGSETARPAANVSYDWPDTDGDLLKNLRYGLERAYIDAKQDAKEAKEAVAAEEQRLKLVPEGKNKQGAIKKLEMMKKKVIDAEDDLAKAEKAVNDIRPVIPLKGDNFEKKEENKEVGEESEVRVGEKKE